MNNEVLKPTEQNPQGYGPKKPEILNLARKTQALNRVKFTKNGAYIDNVPPISLNEWRACTVSGCLMLMLNSIGFDVTYEQISGLTGSCYRTNFLYGWDSASNIVDTSYDCLGFNTSDNATLAYGVECYTAPDESTRDGMVCDSIDNGIPVLVLDGRGEPEYGVICGYERAGRDVRFFGRSYFDRGAPAEELFTENKYTLFNHYPGYGPKMYRPCQPTKPLKAMKTSLESCLAMFKPHDNFGYDAYRKMIQSFECNRFVSQWNNDANVGVIIKNLTDARRAASIYLNENARLLDGENRNRMMAAASLYQAMFRVLKGILDDKNFNNSTIRNNEEIRQYCADSLRQCMEYERQVRDIIQNILDHWEE